jgi:hypothetical protein
MGREQLTLKVSRRCYEKGNIDIEVIWSFCAMWREVLKLKVSGWCNGEGIKEFTGISVQWGGK